MSRVGLILSLLLSAATLHSAYAGSVVFQSKYYKKTTHNFSNPEQPDDYPDQECSISDEGEVTITRRVGDLKVIEKKSIAFKPSADIFRNWVKDAAAEKLAEAKAHAFPAPERPHQIAQPFTEARGATSEGHDPDVLVIRFQNFPPRVLPAARKILDVVGPLCETQFP